MFGQGSYEDFVDKTSDTAITSHKMKPNHLYSVLKIVTKVPRKEMKIETSQNFRRSMELSNLQKQLPKECNTL